MIDRWLKFLTVASVVIFAIASLLLGLWGNIPYMIYFFVIVWGVSVGGFATITQTALSQFAKESIDIAQSMYTTGWNTAVACSGIIGGILLNRSGVASFPWVVIGILSISLLGVVFVMNKAYTVKK